jgi:nitrogen regulatory protein P-II 2
MQLKELKLITIVSEAVLRDRLTEVIQRSGATGYTVSDANGEGSRGTRRSGVHGENIRIEVVAPQAIAEAIMLELAQKFFDKYAVIAWVIDVAVMRGAKYEPPAKGSEGQITK